MYKNRSQGFTLIELLVVIAIIGILSAVVLASLSTARQKGNDAAIQSDFAAIQSQAEIFYGSNSTAVNSYGNAATLSCSTAGSVFADLLITRAINGATTAAGNQAPVCNNTASAYAISIKLNVPQGLNGYWCVDSGGGGKAISANLGSGVTTCP